MQTVRLTRPISKFELLYLAAKQLTVPVWEEGSLPGAGTGGQVLETHDALTKTVYQTPILPNHSLNRTSHEAGAESTGDQTHLLNGRPRHPLGVPSRPRNFQRRLSMDYRPKIQELIYPIPTGSVQHVPSLRSHPAPPNGPSTSAYLKFRNGGNADGEYVFMVLWGTMITNMKGESMSESRQARNRLDQICNTTETYIPTPELDSNIAYIYGDNAQVAHAQEQLRFFEIDTREQQDRPGRANWIRMRALDGRREHREERQTKLQEYLQLYRQRDSDIEYEFEDYVIWPPDLDLEQFIANYDTSVLLEIRREQMCRINFDIRWGLIHTSAPSEKTLMMIRGRLVNLVKEMVAKLNQRMKLNLFRLPSTSVFRNRVGLDLYPKGGLYLPTLFGEPLPKSEGEQWSTLRKQTDRQNRRLISLSLTKCLKTMQAANHHARMRVTFGELALGRHKRPADAAEDYEFDEFVATVRNERTELKSLGLRSTNGVLSMLPDEIDKMSDIFTDPVGLYAVHFDFHVAGQNAILRLEAEFRELGVPSEIERMTTRWLEYSEGQNTELLEINMLEFGKPNWELHVGAVPFHDNPRTRAQLDTFAHNLGFRPTAGSSKTPRRRAIYPPGRQDLRQLTEVTLRRYRFKNTEGVFELRRKDMYDETPGHSSSLPISTQWSAAYYYPEWDFLLGQLAGLDPGEQPNWPLELPTFFRDSPNVERPDGFRKFMREVEEIQDLLADAVANLPKKVEGADE